MQNETNGPLAGRYRRPARGMRGPWLTGLFGLLIGAALVWTAGPGLGGPVPAPYPNSAPALSAPGPVKAGAEQPGATGLTAEEQNTVAVVDAVSPGVVQIVVDGADAPHPGASRSSGSGFVWDREGHIVTNNHVVEGGGRISAIFHGGSVVTAKVVGTDRLTDLAVLQVSVPAGTLVPLVLADSDQVRVGQKAIAIGSPLGIGDVSDEFGLDGEPTVTQGIVSARDRSLPIVKSDGTTEFRIRGLIQTDAAINPGNSGGPLLDSSGRVMGVNTAIIPTAQGIGFAIPAGVVQRVAPQLIAQGRVVRPQLGIEFLSLDVLKKQLRDAFPQLSLPVDRGAMVTRVLPGSGAAAAGIHGSTGTRHIDGVGDVPVGGDIIVSVNGRAVAGEDLPDAVLGFNVGNQVTLGIYRDGRLLNVQVTLGRREP